MTEQEYEEIPQPEEVTRKDRDDAMGSYMMMFASTAVGLPLPVVNLIASVIYYFINRGRGRFTHFHALQSLLSQLPTSLLNSGLVFWTIRNVFKEHDFTDAYWGYLLMVVAANLLYMIFSIVAAVRAYKGRMFYFLFFGKIAYMVAYKKSTEEPNQAPVNSPPKL